MILKSVPDSLLMGLPKEDSDAIQAQVGKHVIFYRKDHQIYEVGFEDGAGDLHTIWIDVAHLEFK